MKDFLKIWISEKRDIFLVPLEVTENRMNQEKFSCSIQSHRKFFLVHK